MNLHKIVLVFLLAPVVVLAGPVRGQEEPANCNLVTTIVKRVDASGKETVTQESKTVCKEGTLISPEGMLSNCGIMQSWKNGRIINTQICQRGDNNWQVVLPN